SLPVETRGAGIKLDFDSTVGGGKTNMNWKTSRSPLHCHFSLRTISARSVVESSKAPTPFLPTSPSPQRGEGLGVTGRVQFSRLGFLWLCFIVLSVGCAVGPKYKRPDYPIPTNHRSETALPPASTAVPAQTFGDLKWFDLFRDEKLQELVRIALKDNYDVRI